MVSIESFEIKFDDTSCSGLDGESGCIFSRDAPKAYLQFSIHDSKSGPVFDILHVFVPKKMRGHGIAELFCHQALLFSKEKGLRIMPTCTYVRNTFISRHQDLADSFVAFDE